MSELLNCPFCGGKGVPRNAEAYNRWSVSCDSCWVTVDSQWSEAAATDKWNRRAPQPVTPAGVEVEPRGWLNEEGSYLSTAQRDRMIASGASAGASIGEVTFGKIAEKHDIPLYTALQADAREKGEAVDVERFRELPAKWLHERAEMASARRGHNPHNEGIIATLDRCARELEARLIATQPAQASEKDNG